jgi:hypothetical protein
VVVAFDGMIDLGSTRQVRLTLTPLHLTVCINLGIVKVSNPSCRSYFSATSPLIKIIPVRPLTEKQTTNRPGGRVTQVTDPRRVEGALAFPTIPSLRKDIYRVQRKGRLCSFQDEHVILDQQDAVCSLCHLPKIFVPVLYMSTFPKCRL